MNLLDGLMPVILALAAVQVIELGQKGFKYYKEVKTKKQNKTTKDQVTKEKVMSAIFETKRSVKQLLDDSPQMGLSNKLDNLDIKISALTEGLIKLVDRIDIKK